MEKKRNWRAIFTWILAGFSVLYALPSVVEMPAWYPFSKKIKGGLDLQGGLELRYTVDWKKAIEETTTKAADSLQTRVAEALAKAANESFEDLPAEKLAGYISRVDVKVEDIDRATLTFKDDAAFKAFETLESPMDLVDERYELAKGDKTVTITLPDKAAVAIRTEVVRETRDNLEKRVAGMGLVDPDVRATGDSDVAVQVPGVGKEQMEFVRSVLGRTAQLTMRYVERQDPWLASADVKAALDAFTGANPAATGLETRSSYGGVVVAPKKADLVRFVRTLTVPADHTIGFEYVEDVASDGTIREKFWQAVYLRANVEITGAHLARARTGYNDKNQPSVYLDLNSEGARLFGDTTEKNVGELLAIMLDEDINSAPQIKDKIAGGRAEISMGSGGRSAMLEAQALTEVLNQGAYQAPVYKVHDHDVGPSLGADSVAAGGISLLLGFGIVALFMVVYYRKSGLIAVAVLTFNLLLIFVLLVSLNTALTLPGVAGIILTLGMAVDGNIIIYERIREELRDGRTPRLSVETGFGKALSAIIDGNLTTALTAFVLMNFTSGPIHNFAVTLLVGICTSVFTSVFVSRLIFNWWVFSKKPATLSI
jgi:preprotein translocase subunit SecD